MQRSNPRVWMLYAASIGLLLLLYVRERSTVDELRDFHDHDRDIISKLNEDLAAQAKEFTKEKNRLAKEITTLRSDHQQEIETRERDEVVKDKEITEKDNLINKFKTELSAQDEAIAENKQKTSDLTAQTVITEEQLKASIFSLEHDKKTLQDDISIQKQSCKEKRDQLTTALQGCLSKIEEGKQTAIPTTIPTTTTPESTKIVQKSEDSSVDDVATPNPSVLTTVPLSVDKSSNSDDSKPSNSDDSKPSNSDDSKSTASSNSNSEAESLEEGSSTADER